MESRSRNAVCVAGSTLADPERPHTYTSSDGTSDRIIALRFDLPPPNIADLFYSRTHTSALNYLVGCLQGGPREGEKAGLLGARRMKLMSYRCSRPSWTRRFVRDAVDTLRCTVGCIPHRNSRHRKSLRRVGRSTSKAKHS